MEIVWRATFVFAFLWVVTRISGRSTLGELSTFQMVLYVTMGDLVQQGVTQQDYSVTGAVLAISVFTLLTVAVSFVNSRSSKLRPVTHGTAVVVIQSGAPVMAAMRHNSLSVNDLLAAARNQGIDDLSDVELAVLETNGRISFFTGHRPSSGASEGAEVA
jgi:uncharacterized membrane protein YcaP (DUF421 family)